MEKNSLKKYLSLMFFLFNFNYVLYCQEEKSPNKEEIEFSEQKSKNDEVNKTIQKKDIVSHQKSAVDIIDNTKKTDIKNVDKDDSCLCLDSINQQSDLGTDKFVTLSELDYIQQKTILLQAELEQKKVYKQLDDISEKKPNENTLKPFVEKEKTEKLSFEILFIYGDTNKLIARLLINKSNRFLDVKVGDKLFDGSEVVDIKQGYVKLRKGNICTELMV